MFSLSNCKVPLEKKDELLQLLKKWKEKQDHIATYLDNVSDWIYEAEISTKNLGNRDIEDSYCDPVYNTA